MADRIEDLRWRVELEYRSDNGPIVVEHWIEELDEIHSLVEAGPDWNALIMGRFFLNVQLTPGLVVDSAMLSARQKGGDT